jgi:hypothetical protein
VSRHEKGWFPFIRNIAERSSRLKSDAKSPISPLSDEDRLTNMIEKALPDINKNTSFRGQKHRKKRK